MLPFIAEWIISDGYKSKTKLQTSNQTYIIGLQEAIADQLPSPAQEAPLLNHIGQVSIIVIV